MIKKTVQEKKDYFIEFSEDEMEELGISPGDKFSVEMEGDSIVLKKFASLDLDLSEFGRQELEALVRMSCERDMPISDLIVEILEKVLDKD